MSAAVGGGSGSGAAGAGRGPWYYRAARAIALKVIPQPQLPVTWDGNFATWDDAAAACAGYAQTDIVERAVLAAREVIAGRSAYDRDGVTFAEREYSWQLLSSLLYAASDDRTLSVVDVGGSLGSAYRQHAPMLDQLESVRWTVVEQPLVADAGRVEFATDSLRFTDRIEDAGLALADVAHFGSSLCYLPNPDDFLDAVCDAGTPFLVIDRTPYAADESATGRRIAVQNAWNVADRTVRESYPSWIFTRSEMEARLSRDYELVAWWRSDLQPTLDPIHWGCLWRRK